MKIAIPDTRLGISCREFDDFAIGVSGFRFTLFCFESCLERQSGERGRAEAEQRQISRRECEAWLSYRSAE